MRAVAVGALSLALSLPAASAVAQAFDLEAVALAARSLTARQATGYGGRQRPCTEFFEVSNVRLADKRVAGATAQIEVVFLVRSKHRIESGSFAADQCYGAPAGGWNPGQAATSRAGFRLERWDAGWRIVGAAPLR